MRGARAAASAPGAREPVHGETRRFACATSTATASPRSCSSSTPTARTAAPGRASTARPAPAPTSRVAHFWGNASSSPTMADLDGDGRPELVSTDDRFAYDFNGYAGSVRPIQIWSFARGAFHDVTRGHPAGAPGRGAAVAAYVPTAARCPEARGVCCRRGRPSSPARRARAGRSRATQRGTARLSRCRRSTGRAIRRRTSRRLSGCFAARATPAEPQPWTRCHSS